MFSPFSLRKLHAFYAHNFGSNFPVQCISNAYASPYRLYFTEDRYPNPDAIFTFSLETAPCLISSSPCCSKGLDRLRIRTGA